MLHLPRPWQSPLERAPREGDNLGPYLLDSEIAQGGMAGVYLAYFNGRREAHTRVAIKCLHPHLAREEDFVALFAHEAEISSRIKHANVCRVIDFDENRGVYYLVMDYVPGQTLCSLRRRLNKSRPRRTPARVSAFVARIVSEAAEALHAAHELRDGRGAPLDVVHSDVSPENILVADSGYVKLLDFGVASSARAPKLGGPGWLRGKYAYLAPEVVAGQRPDRRADIWSLGVVAWEMLTGRRLFRCASDAETLGAVQIADIPSPSSICAGVSEELSSIVLRALSRNRDKRFQSSRELGRHLVQYLVGRRLAITPSEIRAWTGALPAARAPRRPPAARESAFACPGALV